MKRSQCLMPYGWKMERSVGLCSSHSWFVQKQWLSISARELLVHDMECDSVPEAPVPEVDGLHAKGGGSGAILFLYIYNCCHIV